MAPLHHTLHRLNKMVPYEHPFRSTVDLMLKLWERTSVLEEGDDLDDATLAVLNELIEELGWLTEER